MEKPTSSSTETKPESPPSPKDSVRVIHFDELESLLKANPRAITEVGPVTVEPLTPEDEAQLAAIDRRREARKEAERKAALPRPPNNTPEQRLQATKDFLSAGGKYELVEEPTPNSKE